MKEKDFLKKVTDLNMPDKELIRQRVISSKAKGYNNRKMRKFVLAISCLFALVFSTMIIPEFQNKLIDKDSTLTNESDIKDNIIINNLEAFSNAKVDLGLNKAETYEKYLSLEEVIKYLGRDIRPKVLPEGVQDFLVVNPDYKFKSIYKNDGTILLDEFIFSYKEDFNSDEYNPLGKALTITASKVSNTKDYIFFGEDEMKKSQIQGIEIMIGRGEISYGPYTVVEEGSNIPAGYYNLYLAEFKLDDIRIEVIADNLSENEFIQALMSIIK